MIFCSSPKYFSSLTIFSNGLFQAHIFKVEVELNGENENISENGSTTADKSTRQMIMALADALTQQGVSADEI